MKLIIEFSDKETLALRNYAAQQIASADERSMIAAIRVIVLEHLSLAQFLDRTEINSDIVASALAANAVVITKPLISDNPTINLKDVNLELPERLRANRETNTWKVFRLFIESCISNGNPDWQRFTIREIADELSVEPKHADQGVRALVKGNWLNKIAGNQYGFAESAKTYLLSNKSKLRDLALLK